MSLPAEVTNSDKKISDNLFPVDRKLIIWQETYRQLCKSCKIQYVLLNIFAKRHNIARVNSLKTFNSII